LVDGYVIPIYTDFHDVILNYFQDVSESYNDIRKYVLISTCISTLLYYLFVIRPSLYYEERKKQLTRTMITLLPTKIVAYSDALQLALKRLKLD